MASSEDAGVLKRKQPEEEEAAPKRDGDALKSEEDGREAAAAAAAAAAAPAKRAKLEGGEDAEVMQVARQADVVAFLEMEDEAADAMVVEEEVETEQQQKQEREEMKVDAPAKGQGEPVLEAIEVDDDDDDDDDKPSTLQVETDRANDSEELGSESEEDVSDDGSGSESGGGGGTGRHRATTSIADYGSSSEWLHVDDEKLLEEELNYDALMVKRETQSAISSCLLPHAMSPLELKKLPEFKDYQDFYIQIRNPILAEWQSDVTRYLTLKRGIKQIMKIYVPAAIRIFGFLEQYGFINIGLLPKDRDDDDERRPRGKSRKIVVIGAGMSGLSAARQLQSMGHEVVVLEGRDRVGGRVCTDETTFSGPVDLGASILTGLVGNPLTVLCRQALSIGKGQGGSLATLLHTIKDDCPIYGTDGQILDETIDLDMEKAFNMQLEGCAVLREERVKRAYEAKGEKAPECKASSNPDFQVLKGYTPEDGRDLREMDLYTGMAVVREKLGLQYTEEEMAVIMWHAANLEYGCCADLRDVSMCHYDQDDAHGFEGSHCLVRAGYNPLVSRMAEVLDVRLGHICEKVSYRDDGVSVTAMVGGERVTVDADTVLCTLPLGVLKHGNVQFEPALPQWKQKAIDSLGFGLLNKLVMEFEESFWGKDVDIWGCVNRNVETRGRFYNFWNLERSMGKPVLVALMAGKAAHEFEKEDGEHARDECMELLRSVFGPSTPAPIRFHCTAWKSDPMARGSYSFVAKGATGDEYDELARPVGQRLFFAGEACNRNHPATVHGAMLSGLRIAGDVDAASREWAALDLSRATRDGEYEIESVTKFVAPEDRRRHPSGPVDENWLAAYRENAIRKKKGYRTSFQSVVELMKEREEKRAAEEAKIAEARRAAVLRRLENAAQELLNGAIGGKQGRSIERPTARHSPSSLIRRHDQEVNLNSFGSKTANLAGLPSLASFEESDDDDKEDQQQAGETAEERAARRAARREKKRLAHKSKKSKSKRKEKSAKISSKTPSSSSKSKSKSQSKSKSKGSSKKGGAPDNTRDLLAMYLRGVMKKHQEAVSREDYKTIAKKATDKVHEDWKSKDRGSLKLNKWLSDKRKEKIAQLVEGYVKKYKHRAP